MTVSIDYNDLYEYAVKYIATVFFPGSKSRLGSLNEAERDAIEAYFTSGAALNNADLKTRVINGIKGGVRLINPVSHEGEIYQYNESEQASMLYIAGGLGSFRLVDEAMRQQRPFRDLEKLHSTYAGNPVIVDFFHFKAAMRGLDIKGTPMQYNGEPDHDRARAIFSGINGALMKIAVDLKAKLVADNKLDPAGSLH